MDKITNQLKRENLCVSILKANLGEHTSGLLNFGADIAPLAEKMLRVDNNFHQYIFLYRDWFTKGYYEDNTRKTYSRDTFVGWDVKEGRVYKTRGEDLIKKWKANLERLFRKRYYPPLGSLFVIDSNVTNDFIDVLKSNNLEWKILNLEI